MKQKKYLAEKYEAEQVSSVLCLVVLLLRGVLLVSFKGRKP